MNAYILSSLYVFYWWKTAEKLEYFIVCMNIYISVHLHLLSFLPNLRSSDFLYFVLFLFKKSNFKHIVILWVNTKILLAYNYVYVELGPMQHVLQSGNCLKGQCINFFDTFFLQKNRTQDFQFSWQEVYILFLAKSSFLPT